MTSDAQATGSPAFPSHGTMGEIAHEGMTLRDYFAAKALQAFLTRIPTSGPEQARAAYLVADAMIAQRNAK